MKLSRINQFLIVLVGIAFLALGGCDTQAKRAMESVDQKLKPLGVQKTEMSLFVVDPETPDRAYISLIATWNFANSSGQPTKETLGYIIKKDGNTWQIEKQGIRYTDDRNNALTVLKGGKF